MGIYRKTRHLAWRASMSWLARGPHITRYSMYKRLQEIAPALPNRDGRVLSVSHSRALAEAVQLEPCELVDADYPDHNILSLGFANESFDYVLSDQVLEHVEGDPFQAISECHRVLRTGGIAIHTTCFINPIHDGPGDYWRFTPEALALLHNEWSEVIESGGWGNFKAWTMMNDGLRFIGVPHSKWHPLHRCAVLNDPLWPIVTWVIARK